jgi:hypothetical protein
MKQALLSIIITAALSLQSGITFAGAGGHAGHGGKGGSNSGASCKKPLIGHAKPPHLSTVPANAEFSFWVEGISNPNLVTVTAKKIPVPVSAEKRADFYVFTGKLPETLTSSAARILVKVNAPKCPAEKGWLLKIDR